MTLDDVKNLKVGDRVIARALDDEPGEVIAALSDGVCIRWLRGGSHGFFYKFGEPVLRLIEHYP